MLPLSGVDILTSKEFAALYKLDDRAVRRAVAAGQLPGIRIGNSTRVYCAGVRETFIAKSADEDGE